MPAVPKRFIITYLLAFALLWGIGMLWAGTSIDAPWTRSPFEQRKINPGGDAVEVYIIQSEDGGMDYIPLHVDSDEYGNSGQPAPWEADGYIGSVWIMQSWYPSVSGPFLTRTDTYLRAGRSRKDGYSVLPASAIERAKQIAYEKALLWLDTPHFYENQLYFESPSTELDWIIGGLRLEYSAGELLPPWLIPILFAFLPFLTAWTVTAATTRPKPNPT